MPSAANVKVDKQISPESSGLSDSSGSLTPLRQAITIIEHKIRNLEKRKSKLESYRDLQNAGKELNADQKTAVAKYNEVVQTLDFARDLCKQFLGIAACSEKEAKRQAKKESAAKSQAELARLREILLVQDALNQMGNETVRDDFLLGRNGATQLSEHDLKLLDDLYPAVTPKHESGNPTAFTNEVQTAAEHLLAVVDGKPKEIFGGSYSQVKEILGKIHESGYFDQAQEYTSEVAVVEEEVVYVVDEQEAPALEQEPAAFNQPEIIPEGVTQQQLQQQSPPQQIHDNSNVENVPTEQQQIYYQQTVPQSQIPMQPQPPVRPITEVLGSGSFSFLQDSEIDNTPLDQIPSQTYTNQSFVTGPPPPIPMPPHYQTIGNNLPPQLQQQSAPPIPKNGIDDPNNAMSNESMKPMHHGGSGNRQRNNNYYHQQQTTNNNYNNRPRQNRNNNNMTRQGNNNGKNNN